MSPDEAVRAYFAAFEAKDSEAIVALFGPNGLYELPFLRPRLVGAAEIRAGLERAFAVVESCTMTLDRVKRAGPVAIAEGCLAASVPRDGVTMTVPFAIVVELRGAAVARLTVHLDARPYRLWTDGPVQAFDA